MAAFPATVGPAARAADVSPTGLAPGNDASVKDRGTTVVVFGDSISAGYGMSPHEGWVALLSNQLQAQSLNYHVVNASVSGETTGGGRARINGTLEIHNPDVIVLELGGNDGLRGYPIDNIRNNLIDMVKASQASGAKVLVIGMILPPNYGRRYTRAFEGLFSDVADRTGVALIPALLDGIDTAPELLQRDGIHPTADAQPRLLADIWPALKTLLPQ